MNFLNLTLSNGARMNTLRDPETKAVPSVPLGGGGSPYGRGWGQGRISNVEVGGNHFDRVAIWLWALGF